MIRIKRLAIGAALALGSLGVIVGVLIATNPAPVVPAMSSAGDATMPVVVKLHARWCPVCMTTKDVWATVQAEYAGRVRLVVFDFTTESTTQASRREAERLGLSRLFDEYLGETGTVLVLDGTSDVVRFQLHGDRDAAHYRHAIDQVFRPSAKS